MRNDVAFLWVFKHRAWIGGFAIIWRRCPMDLFGYRASPKRTSSAGCERRVSHRHLFQKSAGRTSCFTHLGISRARYCG